MATQASEPPGNPADGFRSLARRRPVCWACCSAFSGAAPAAAASPPASPAGAGADSPRFSAERLQRLDGFLREATDAHGYLGAVSLVSSRGEVVQSQAYGYRDLARTEPMRIDSIFRIYSMTKTVTTVAVLMLMEEGKLNLDDPVEKFLPEFADMKVFAGGSADAPQLRACEEQDHACTSCSPTRPASPPAVPVTNKRPGCWNVRDLHGSADLAEFSRRLSRVPLAVEPGTRFSYDGTQLEVLARVVEVVSGQRFDAFLQQRLFDPLRMADTGFSVPMDKRDRIVDITVMGADGKLRLDDGPSAVHPGAMLNPYHQWRRRTVFHRAGFHAPVPDAARRRQLSMACRYSAARPSSR